MAACKAACFYASIDVLIPIELQYGFVSIDVYDGVVWLYILYWTADGFVSIDGYVELQCGYVSIDVCALL